MSRRSSRRATRASLEAKVCVSCKRSRSNVWRCREVLGHIAPNYDVPGASNFFNEGVTADEKVAAGEEEPSKRRRKVEDEEMVEFAAVPVLDARCGSSAARAEELRRSGIPFVFENVDVNLGFARRWVRDGAVETDRIVEEIGDARAPILRRAYSAARPIKESMTVSAFLEAWPGDTSAYLHQWQFPLDETVAAKLCDRRPLGDLPGLDDDLLCHWTRRSSSVLQYLFMGGAGTASRLHVDSGGLDLLIAPLVGVKEVTMVHRDDAEFVDPAQPWPPRRRDAPLLALLRCWRHAIRRDQVLVVPESTPHAVRNLEPCLSYHRFHLDRVNFLGFWRALIDGDGHGIRPAEILWNAAHGAMKRLDHIADAKYYKTSKTKTPADDETKAATTLKAISNLVAAVNREFEPAEGALVEDDRQRGADFDWNGLLFDINNSIDHWTSGVDRATNKTAPAATRDPTIFDENHDQQPPQKSPPPPPLRVSRGDLVCVKFHRKRLRARVLSVDPDARMARVHYATYGDKYDELVPLDRCIAPKNARDPTAFTQEPGARCRVPWGANNQLYNAKITDIYTGPAFKVHYISISTDWDQWVSPKKILRVLKDNNHHS